MARRKGLLAQILDARKQAKKLEAQAEARRHRELIAEQRRQKAEAQREAKQAEAAAKHGASAPNAGCVERTSIGDELSPHNSELQAE